MLLTRESTLTQVAFHLAMGDVPAAEHAMDEALTSSEVRRGRYLARKAKGEEPPLPPRPVDDIVEMRNRGEGYIHQPGDQIAA